MSTLATIDVIVCGKGPIRMNVVAQDVAGVHGWQRTGNRTLKQVRKAMDGTEIRVEFGSPFARKSVTTEAELLSAA